MQWKKLWQILKVLAENSDTIIAAIAAAKKKEKL